MSRTTGVKAPWDIQYILEHKKKNEGQKEIEREESGKWGGNMEKIKGRQKAGVVEKEYIVYGGKRNTRMED